MAFTTNSLNAPYPLYTSTASPTAHSIPIIQSNNSVNQLALTLGQIPYGQTSADPIALLLQAISTWNDQTTSSVTMAVNNGYISDDGATLVTLTLPTTSPLGSVFAVQGKGSGLFKLAQNVGQSIIFGSNTTTSGTGGSLSSILANDAIYLVTTTANNIFTVFLSSGNFAGV